MTKRAGKRKFRMGSQRHPAGAIKNRPDTFAEDHLPPKESLKLEMQAVLRNWLSDSPSIKKLCKLKEKMIEIGSQTDDPETLCRIIRTIAQIEQSAVRNILASEKVDDDKKPVVIVQQNNAGGGRDTLQELIDSMTPSEAVELLNKYGPRISNIVPANGGPVSGQSQVAVSG